MPVSAASTASCSMPKRCSAEPRSAREHVSIQCHLYGFYVGCGDKTETYDLLVVSELEVVLHHTVFVSGSVQTINKPRAGSKWKWRERTS